jgi:hypothetical protein
MSEQKLCPFFYSHMNNRWISASRYSSETKPMPKRIEEDASTGLGVCLQDKCAMWRTTRNFSHGETGFHEDKEATGYCGLAGKP